MGNACCAQDMKKDADYEHIAGAKIKNPAVNPIDETESHFLGSQAPATLTGTLAEAHQYADGLQLITDINDEDNGGKYYGETETKTTETGEVKRYKSGRGKYVWADGREYDGEW